jgi:hypothetical protein
MNFTGPGTVEKYKVLSPLEACAYDSPALYGITDAKTGCVVYVGRTKNLSNRMKAYMNAKWCHNGGLKSWLKEKCGLFVVSLFHFGDDLYDAERRLIAKMRDKLFNLVGGGVVPWHSHNSLPWMCGAGIRCPSDLAIWHLLRSDKAGQQRTVDRAKKMRSKMTTLERCRYEASLAMNFPAGFSNSLEKWRVRAEHKMILALEHSTSGGS